MLPETVVADIGEKGEDADQDRPFAGFGYGAFALEAGVLKTGVVVMNAEAVVVGLFFQYDIAGDG